MICCSVCGAAMKDKCELATVKKVVGGKEKVFCCTTCYEASEEEGIKKKSKKSKK